MHIERAQQPIAAAAVTLVLLIVSIASFLPPLFEKYTSQSVLFIIAAGISTCVCLVLHFVFIGIAAKRLGRAPLLWVLLALFTFPIGSIIGLILFEWFSQEQKQASA
ncbi:hypothetical protein SAMN05216319_0133 [Duganella sp. CF402]|uniref:hypothetical protein n=1 Tax=unclassified Duganella TaxID=2636909 RepID=UPI0008AB75E4|nr:MULTISPECIES: hypothetical protein [unclassified Duganella]RZT11386.1 hypothetical protein EV582_3493 [Duganella sp. BK701]SEK66889.1 hypothetical protein SAMN05216319_0133 [Duganella sp. CF402]